MALTRSEPTAALPCRNQVLHQGALVTSMLMEEAFPQKTVQRGSTEGEQMHQEQHDSGIYHPGNPKIPAQKQSDESKSYDQ